MSTIRSQDTNDKTEKTEEDISKIKSIPITINVDGLGSDTAKTYNVTLTKPNGDKIEVNRYFRAPEEGEQETYPGWVEISEDEYTKRVFRAGGIKHYHNSGGKNETK